MLQSPITPATSSHSLRGDRRKTQKFDPEEYTMDDDMYDDDFDGGDGGDGGGKGRSKSRRELPTGAVATLKAWLLSPEHFTHPYPTPQDQAMLMQKTGIDKKQLKNWFTNARRRIWKPMLKKQIELGKISANASSGYPGMDGNGANPGASMDNPHSVQAVRVHYQQAMQEQNSVQQQQAAVRMRIVCRRVELGIDLDCCAFLTAIIIYTVSPLSLLGINRLQLLTIMGTPSIPQI